MEGKAKCLPAPPVSDEVVSKFRSILFLAFFLFSLAISEEMSDFPFAQNFLPGAERTKK
jgi:hypothetical protein